MKDDVGLRLASRLKPSRNNGYKLLDMTDKGKQEG
jgi:hypothetical protein